MAPTLLLLLPLLFLLHAAIAAVADAAPAAAVLSLAPGLQFSPALTWSIPSPASSSIVNAYPNPPYGPFSIFSPVLSSASFLSADRGFSFGFLSVFDHPSNVSSAVHVYLAVCLGSGGLFDDLGRGFALPVWVANQNNPLSPSNTGSVLLAVSVQRELLLTAADGSVVWQVQGSAAAMALSDDGNLAILSFANQTIWQSFDDPEDVLLQGQVLPAGSKSVSRNSMYAMEMRAGGLLLYMQSSYPAPLAYFLVLLNKTVNDDVDVWITQGTFAVSRDLAVNFTAALDSPAEPPGSACASNAATQTPFAALEGSNFTLFYGRSCPSVLNVSWPSVAYFQNHIANTLYDSDFVRLDVDGIIRGYTYLFYQNQHYLSSDRANFSLCFAPNACGPNSVCVPYATGQQHYCRCLSQEDDPGFADTFVQVDPLYPSLGCRRTIPLQCEAGVNQSLVRMEGATFISFRAVFEGTLSLHEPVSLDDCIQSCAFNCSCSGLYYHVPTSFCLPFSDNMPIGQVSMISQVTADYVAYFKVQYDSPQDDVAIEESSIPSRGSNPRRRFLLAFLVGGTLLLGCMIALFAFYEHKRRRGRKQYFIDEKDPEIQDILPMLPLRFQYRELRKATSGFSKVVGKGAFGTVFEGTLPDSTRVAVKRLEMIVPQVKPFLTEVATIGSISHFNVVRLHGYCSERLHRLLVYDYMENGSLDRWLFIKDGAEAAAQSSQQEALKSVNVGLTHTRSNTNLIDGSIKESNNAILYMKNSSGLCGKNGGKVLSWETRYAIALGTARALAYLHEDSPRPIIHFDVKPENILLDRDFVPKLSDFGLAKLVERGASNVFTLVRGTAGYMAPEWLSHSLVSKKCDVYSYGMVLLELVGGRRNADPEYASTDQWYFPKWAAVCCREANEGELVDKRLHGIYDGEQLKSLVRVAFLCIHKDPNQRPSMSTVCKLLEKSCPSSSNCKKEMDMEHADNPSFDHLLHDTLTQFDNLQGTGSEDTNAYKSSPISLYSSIHGR